MVAKRGRFLKRGENKVRSVSIKKNFFMNIVLTGSSYIFPLITFPYISRVLQATINGKLNFALSITNYFVTFASLGIPIYGIKACAVVRDDKKELSKTVKELFVLNFITSVISFLTLLAIIELIPKFQEYTSLLLIDSIAIWLNLISVEWLFKALEEYTYITNRSIAFKIISVILMFVFVHKQADYIIYAIISLIGTSGSLVLNVVRCRKLINFRDFVKLDIKKHIGPVFSFFFLSASWTLYMNLDTVMLGFIAGDTEVGYYAAAVKLKGILVSTISALGTVLLPRLTSFFSKNKMEEFYKLLRSDAQFITIAAVYFTSFCVINAREIMMTLSGNTYLPAVPAMQIISISILFIGFSTMLGTNVLIPMGKEKITMLATLVGLVVDAALNFLWIPIYGAAGAAVATVIGEITIFLFEVIYLRGIVKKMFDIRALIKEIIAVVISMIVLTVVKFGIINKFPDLFLIIITGILFTVVYLLMLLLLGDSFLKPILNNILKRFKMFIVK